MGPIALGTVTIDCPDPTSLAAFYMRLLGWHKSHESEGYICITSPTCGVRIGFQRNLDYVPPVWPETPSTQQQMVHLDFHMKDKEEMEAMVAHALRCGAQKASEQYSDLWTVMLDPAGHPFCLDTL